MFRQVCSARLAAFHGAALAVVFLIASCDSGSRKGDVPDGGSGEGGAQPGPNDMGGSGGGSAGVSSDSVEAACDTYATGHAHVRRACELGQVMVRGDVVHAVGEGGAGAEPRSPWSPEDVHADYRAAFEECAELVAEFPLCAPELLQMLSCQGEAIYVCIQDDVAQAPLWTTYDCRAREDEVDRCFEASL
jgi:hypothetical protein